VVVPNLMASNGVIRLPIPNPTTVAVAPERTATMNTARRNTGTILSAQGFRTPPVIRHKIRAQATGAADGW
jgi:hypothetical protein